LQCQERWRHIFLPNKWWLKCLDSD
jgi:hypothetical protein